MTKVTIIDKELTAPKTSLNQAYCKRCKKVTMRYSNKNPRRLGNCKPCSQAYKQRPKVKEAHNATMRKIRSSTRIRNGKTAIYLVKMSSQITSESFWKVGSSINVKQRLAKLRESGYKVELVKCILLPEELCGREVEVKLHESISNAYVPSITFNGFTECYSDCPNIDLYLFRDCSVLPPNGIDCTY